MDSSPTVFFVDDHLQLHDSLRALMASVGLRTETYATATAFLKQFDPSREGCLLLDVRMPEMSGLELYAELRRRESHLPVLFLTGHADIAMAIEAIRSGAFEFLEKPVGDQRLLDAVHRAIRADALVRKEHQERATIRARLASLHSGEREVLNLLLEGHSNKAMAARLGVCEKTIEYRRAKLMEKMECDHVAVLIRQVLSLGSSLSA